MLFSKTEKYIIALRDWLTLTKNSHEHLSGKLKGVSFNYLENVLSSLKKFTLSDQPLA